jgi:alpha-glucosidase
VLIGETFLSNVSDVLPFYGRGDQLHLAFNIPFVETPFDAAALRAVIDETEARLPEGCVPVWTGSNHDVSRFPTRWAGADEMKARCALMMLLTLRGCVFLYYGDELGLVDTDVPKDRIVDPVGLRVHPYAGRDPQRTPMPWSAAPGAGFTAAGVEPWLPFGDLAAANVADQRHDPDSFLSLTRDLIGLRDAIPDLRRGLHRSVRAPEGVLAYRRGEALVALNLGGAPATLTGVSGTIRVCTRRSRDGEVLDGAVTLAPGDGVVVWGAVPPG